MSNDRITVDSTLIQVRASQKSYGTKSQMARVPSAGREPQQVNRSREVTTADGSRRLRWYTDVAS